MNTQKERRRKRKEMPIVSLCYTEFDKFKIKTQNTEPTLIPLVHIIIIS